MHMSSYTLRSLSLHFSPFHLTETFPQFAKCTNAVDGSFRSEGLGESDYAFVGDVAQVRPSVVFLFLLFLPFPLLIHL